jgi:site-specific recombinase XerD
MVDDTLATVPERAAPLAVPTVRDPAEPAKVYVASLSTPKSRSTAVEALRRLAPIFGFDGWEAIPWSQVTARETEMARAVVSEKFRPATARLTLSILKGVLRYAFKLGHMSAEQYQRASMLKPIRGETLTKGRAMADAEVAKLWKYIDDEMPGALADMVRAIFAVALGGGLRREEITKLMTEHVSPGAEKLMVSGKGRKERIQQLPKWASEVVFRWLFARSKLRLKTDALFVPIALDGRVTDRPMSELGVWRTVVRVTRAAGIDAISTHDLRRTFATQMLRKERTPIVQKLMGHTNASTTLRYDRSAQEEADRAVKRGLDEWDPKAARVVADSIDQPTANDVDALEMGSEAIDHPTTGQKLTKRKKR